jgi:hypothetical protein
MMTTYLLRRYACRVWLDRISHSPVQSAASRVRPADTNISKALANASDASQGHFCSKLVGNPSRYVKTAHKAGFLN